MYLKAPLGYFEAPSFLLCYIFIFAPLHAEVNSTADIESLRCTTKDESFGFPVDCDC